MKKNGYNLDNEMKVYYLYIYLYTYTHICIYKESRFILYHIASIIQVQTLKLKVPVDGYSYLYYTNRKILIWFLCYSVAYRAKMQLGQLRLLTLI